MITEWDMYLLTRLDHIHQALIPFIVLSVFAAFIVAGIGLLMRCQERDVHGTHDETIQQGEKMHRVYLPVALLFLLIMTCVKVAIPTTKEMAAIKVIPAMANNENLKGLGKDLVEVARDWVKELKPKPKLVK